MNDIKEFSMALSETSDIFRKMSRFLWFMSQGHNGFKVRVMSARGVAGSVLVVVLVCLLRKPGNTHFSKPNGLDSIITLCFSLSKGLQSNQIILVDDRKYFLKYSK